MDIKVLINRVTIDQELAFRKDVIDTIQRAVDKGVIRVKNGKDKVCIIDKNAIEMIEKSEYEIEFVSQTFVAIDDKKWKLFDLILQELERR